MALSKAAKKSDLLEIGPATILIRNLYASFWALLIGLRGRPDLISCYSWTATPLGTSEPA